MVELARLAQLTTRMILQSFFSILAVDVKSLNQQEFRRQRSTVQVWPRFPGATRQFETFGIDDGGGDLANAGEHAPSD
jgi:hypothetical protein